MRVGVIIQARLSSERLPGKVLRSLRGRPMLIYLLERLRHHPLLAAGRANALGDFELDRDSIVLATSAQDDDIPLARYCADQAITCHRGSLTHVAQRCCDAATKHGFDAFFRVCADSPLLDVELLEQALEIAADAEDWDLITNVAPRSFPPGQSVELIRTQTLARILPEIERVDQHEHVTRYLYENPDRFTIRNFCAAQSYGGIRFTVDEPADLQRTEELLSVLARGHWAYGLDELVERLRLLEALEVKLSGVGL